jgi:hypothetical protein
MAGRKGVVMDRYRYNLYYINLKENLILSVNNFYMIKRRIYKDFYTLPNKEKVTIKIVVEKTEDRKRYKRKYTKDKTVRRKNSIPVFT